MDRKNPAKTPATIPKQRGRQRSATAHAAVLKATLTLLERCPLADLTVDAIAAKSKVSKATIYKWWPNKNRVALDAILSRLKTDAPVPDTGSALADFTEHYRTAIRFYASSPGKIITQFLIQSQNDPGLMELFREHFQKPRRVELKMMFARGVNRGEIRAQADPDLLIDLLFGAMIYRILAGHMVADDDFAHAAVHAVFNGVQAPLSSTLGTSMPSAVAKSC
jgi:AcrR family transcriptional regulator